MTHNSLSEQEQLPPSYQPHRIQLFFNGVEVVRIENGQKVYEQLVPDGWRPELMQLFWDDKEVYALRLSCQENDAQEYKVVTNCLLHMVEAAKNR